MPASGHKRRNHQIGDDDTSDSEVEEVSIEEMSKAVSQTEEVAVASSEAGMTEDQSPREARSNEVFQRFQSTVTANELVEIASEYRLPMGCKVMVPSAKCHAAYPPKGFTAVSPQHMELGLRFPIPDYLISLLNDLQLAPFQLTANSYSQITSLAILFRKAELPPPSPKLFRYLFCFKSAKEGLYYISARATAPKSVLPQGKGKGKSNVGDYKSHWFFVSCISLLRLKNFGFRLGPSSNPFLILFFSSFGGFLMLFFFVLHT